MSASHAAGIFDADALLGIHTSFPLAQDLGNVCDITTDALFELA